MTCILNGEDVEKIIKTPVSLFIHVTVVVCLFVWVPSGGLRGICCSQGRRYLGPNGTEMAAIKIQVQLTPLPVSCASQTSSV